MGNEISKSEELRTVTLTVGTAGHIDHGKTELVKFLTGCNTDRLPEERSRGMTIDLGFATCELPDRRMVGIVDVPGHERFIHNMVAGAAGIDVVMLVVAADDGVMPQTIEHFHIVRMLGVKSGMVVVTKSDLATEEQIDSVVDQVKALVAGSFLDGCPIVPFSARTGAGYDDFYNNFVLVVDRTAERNADGPFRLHVERSFILKGLGAIISGIPISGSIQLGDTLELLPAGVVKKVRGLQVYGKDSKVARAGECVALKLSDLSRSDVERGMVLAKEGYFEPAMFVNARFQYLPGFEKPLKPRTAVRFHIGTADIPGHMVLPTLDPLKPGSETYVQFQLKRPVVAAPGDFFVARMLSPMMTIGGGYVVATVGTKMRRSRENWVDECMERETAFETPASALLYVLKNAGSEPVHIERLSHMALLDKAAARKYLEPVIADGSVVELSGDRLVHASVIKKAEAELLSVLGSMHDDRPMSIGFEKKDFLRQIKLNRLIVDKALDGLLKSGVVTVVEAGLCIADRAPSLSPKQAALAEKVEEIFLDAGFVTPRIDQLPELVGVPESLIKPIVEHLMQRGLLVKIDDKVTLHGEKVEESRSIIVDYIEENGSMETSVFKDMLETSRKYSVPLLEYWDGKGLTRRTGNNRVLR